MSSSTLRDFLEKVSADPALQLRFQQLPDAKSEDFAQKLSDLGREAGYSFSPEEVPQLGTGALSEEELDSVSGGAIADKLTSLFTLLEAFGPAR